MYTEFHGGRYYTVPASLRLISEYARIVQRQVHVAKVSLRNRVSPGDCSTLCEDELPNANGIAGRVYKDRSAEFVPVNMISPD